MLKASGCTTVYHEDCVLRTECNAYNAEGVAYLGVHHPRQETDHSPLQQTELFAGPLNQPSEGRIHVVWESAVVRHMEGGFEVWQPF